MHWADGECSRKSDEVPVLKELTIQREPDVETVNEADVPMETWAKCGGSECVGAIHSDGDFRAKSHEGSGV